MSGLVRRSEINTRVYQSPQDNDIEQPFSATEQNRRNRNLQLIDEALSKVLLVGIRPAADPHVASGRRLACTVERLAIASLDEVERGAAFHLDRWARVVGQGEDWNMIRWIVPPPAFPVHVRPRTTNGAEHIPPKYPGSAILKAARGEVIVKPRHTTHQAEQDALERAC